jgi:hypothetical protein
MRRLGLTLALLLLGAVPLHAATVVVAWNASPSPEVTGYRVQYGTAPGIWPQVIDVGPVLTARVPLDPGRYFFTVVAYSQTATSAPTNEVAVTIAASDPCAFPLGATAVSIFVTGKLQKTGSGGPGSRAFITFQAASPNSPIVFLSVRANGVDVPDSVTDGTTLRSVGSLWFTIPPGLMGYAVYGKNAAGCAREQPTGFSTGP